MLVHKVTVLTCPSLTCGRRSTIESNGARRAAQLRVRIRKEAAPGHLLLPEPQWRYLGLPPRTHAKLSRVPEPAACPRPLNELKHVFLQSIMGDPPPPTCLHITFV